MAKIVDGVKNRDGYKPTKLGRVPLEWEVKRLQDVSVKIGSGITPTGGEAVYRKNGRPFIRSQNVGWGVLLLNEIAYIDEETHRSFPSTEVKKGDVLLNITGASIGRCAIADKRVENGNVNQHVCIIRVNDKIAPSFLSSFILSQKGQNLIDSFQAGGNRQGLNFEQIRSFVIPIPPLAEQQKIARILSTWDRAIERTEQLIAQKQQFKKGLMQQLLTGKKRLLGTLSQARRYKLTKLGRIPVDWELKELKYFIKSLETGVSVNSEDRASRNGEYGILKTSALSEGRFRPEENKLIKQDELDRAQINPKKGAILISRMNTPNLVGEIGFVDKDYPNLFLPDRIWQTVYDSKIKVCSEWLTYVLSSEKLRAKMKLIANGTSGSMKNISKDDFVQIRIAVPPVDERVRIAHILQTCDQEIGILSQNLDRLKKQKKGLMQKLLTGEVRTMI